MLLREKISVFNTVIKIADKAIFEQLNKSAKTRKQHDLFYTRAGNISIQILVEGAFPNEIRIFKGRLSSGILLERFEELILKNSMG